MIKFLLTAMMLLSVITATTLVVESATAGNINVSGEATATLTGGTTVTYSGTGGQGGSGGGGGGGGGLSGENYTNIEVNEKYYDYIYKDKVTSYRFTQRGNPVLFVNITGNSSPGEIRASVEVLRDTSTLLKEPAPGIIYKNANIWVGTSGFAIPKNIKEAVIKFRVENAWISGRGLLKNDIRMYKWDGNRWFELKTDAKEADEIYSYFEARTDSFSSFAIIGLKSSEVPAASKTPAGVDTMAGTPQVTDTARAEKTPGFETGIMITAIAGVYLLRRRNG